VRAGRRRAVGPADDAFDAGGGEQLQLKIDAATFLARRERENVGLV
jgi:hypothetical protein